MKRIWNCWLIAGAFWLVSVAHAAESFSVLLQKGIYAEETEGNLDAAMKIYEGITKGTEGNRALVAQAQYRLGVCQLKRGKKDEAEVAFRKIIREFPDHNELTAKARDRLGEMGKNVSSVVVRQVWSGTGASGHSVSRDGRYVAFVDPKTGSIALRDLVSGQNRHFTNNIVGNDGAFPERCVLSHDGKQMAYSLANWGGESFSSALRVLNIDSGVARVLSLQQTNRWWWVEDWSPDGKSMAAIDIQWRHDYMPRNWQGTNSQVWISLVSAGDGAVRKLVSLGGMSPSSISNVRFSADGHYLAYNLSRNANAGGRVQPTNDIAVMDLETGLRNIAVEYVDHENFIGWNPRGLEMLFSSDRSGTTGLWSMEVNRSEAIPKLLKADIGDIKPIGLTRDGAFFYNIATGPLKEFHAASVDFKTGKVLAGPKLFRTTMARSAVRSSGDKASSSGDGRFLYFRSEEKEPIAYIFDLESGLTREIPNSRNWANRIGWWWPQPEEGILFAALSGSENESGLYQVNTQNGEMVPIALDRPGIRQMLTNPIRFNIYRDFVAYGRLYSNPEKFVLVKYDLKSGRETEHEIPGLAPESIPQPRTIGDRNLAVLLSDGRSFFFNRTNASGDLHVLIGHDLLTGKQTEFLTSKSPIGVVNTGSDRMVFFVTTDERQRRVFTLEPEGLVFALFSLEGSELQRQNQVAVPEGFQYRGQHWGKPHLILAKPTKPGLGVSGEIWTLSVPTGELKNLGLSIPNDNFWGLYENCNRLIFHTAAPSTPEVWVMENFLPLIAPAK